MKNTISFNTKFGWISATEINQKITKIQFIKVKNTGVFSKNLKNLRRYFLAYFEGNIKTLKAPIKIIGNSTQRKIWNELKKIPKGETKSYGNIAKRLKMSPRYVGRVCGENKLVLIVPCHRVIKSDGSLGGFSATEGVKLKERLLNFEKIS
tara:strand:- start:65 stop:517 length:453 start_codon:yes stop_codon:yes gene_type:complete